MVTITNALLRESEKGKFVSLELTGDVELIQSMTTGRFYATAKKCSISCTFTQEQAKRLVGTQMPGYVVRIASEPYDYTVPDTGEVITLAHSYTYSPVENNPKALEGVAPIENQVR